MLHLFKKTYIEIDSHIDANIDRIVISKEKGTGFYQELNQFFKGTLYSFGKEINDVAGEGKTFNDFLSMLDFCYEVNTKANKKIVIYCDKDAFMKISSLWFKFIFREPHAATSYTILKSYINKEIYITNAAYNRANNQESYELLDFKELEFTQIFNSTEAIADQNEFFNKIKDSLSLEYYIASYYFDGSYKCELKNIVKLMTERNIYDLTKDVWRLISTNISNEKFRSLLGVTGTYSKNNYIDALYDIRFNSIRSLGADKSYNDHWSSVHPTADILMLSEAQIEEIKDQIVKIYSYVTNGLHNNVDSFGDLLKINLDLYFKIMKSQTLTDEDFEKIINCDSMTDRLEKFWSSVDRRTVNFYLVDNFIEFKKKNQQALLSSYCLK